MVIDILTVLFMTLYLFHICCHSPVERHDLVAVRRTDTSQKSQVLILATPPPSCVNLNKILGDSGPEFPSKLNGNHT